MAVLRSIGINHRRETFLFNYMEKYVFRCETLKFRTLTQGHLIVLSNVWIF